MMAGKTRAKQKPTPKPKSKKIMPSGHARLKAALVMRDALADELGLSLSDVMQTLPKVENNVGAANALHDGKYLNAVSASCRNDAVTLSALDAEVRLACERVRFAPRYAQYLALLLFTHWAEASSSDAHAFSVRLNAWLQAHPPKSESISAFTEADLQLAAFWMATAAGKTHVLHACLALLEKRRAWDRVIVITPSESLTRQHADKLRGLAAWDVFAYPMDGDASSLGRLPPDTVIVLDINKLATEKKGDGVTVPVSVFADGRNLVFVDEGHKGQKSEDSTWKAIQHTLAGIDEAAMPAHRGLLVEFSATFGQVVETEQSFERYAKAVIFDYAYDRFHQDRYGKDFWHVRVQARAEATAIAQRQTLTAALLAFWYQVKCFRTDQDQKESDKYNLKVAAPLWVLLGLSVIGGKNKDDIEQTSDVSDVLAFLSEMLAQPAQLSAALGLLLAAVNDNAADGAMLLPKDVAQTASEIHVSQLAEQVLTDCFGWQTGDKPILRLIKSATGELGLGLLRGDSAHYYGVVNVGDAAGLKKMLEQKHLAIDDDALTTSLFAQLDQLNSGLNVLIGSRRFAEGWDNYRASSLTLLRLGQGVGSLIIQMFGRVVRFAGVDGDGKRLELPPPLLAPLQTAYVYGLQSAYLDVFLKSLVENGVIATTREECKTVQQVVPALRSVRAISPQPQAVVAVGEQWLASLKGRPTTISLSATVASATLANAQVTALAGRVGQNLTDDFKKRVVWLDKDALFRDLVEWRRAKRWWQLRFDMVAIEHALQSGPYEIVGPPEILQIKTQSDLTRLNRIAASVLRGMFEKAYRAEEKRHSRYEAIAPQPDPDKYAREVANGY
jgi:hypothetical protein